MTRQPQRCVACGYIGWDVGPRLVRLEGPKPFGVQVRCVDTEACELRRDGPAEVREREVRGG